MDTGELTTLVPAGGLGAILLVLVGYLLRQIPSDRADYRKDLAEARRRTTEEQARADAAQRVIDAERLLRRQAEAAAAAAQAQLTAHAVTLQWYEAHDPRTRPQIDQSPEALP